MSTVLTREEAAIEPVLSTREQKTSSLPALLVSLGVVALVAWLSLNAAVTNVDVSWLLVVGERVLGGARLHADIVETNPPFSTWLYFPLLWAEAATHIRAEVWLAVAVPLLTLLSLVISASILRTAGWFQASWHAWLLPAAVFVLAWLFPDDFGQREQIASIALLPWLALLVVRDTTPDFRAGRPWQIVIAGIGAAIFVMVKPPMAALALLVPAVWIAYSRRSLRPLLTPESLIGAAITLFYVIWVLIFHQAYLRDVMPPVSEFYMFDRRTIVELIVDSELMAPFYFAIATWLMARPAKIDRASTILLLAAFGYIPGFVLVGKGWTYQAMPFFLFGLLAFSIQLARPAASLKSSALRIAVPLVVSIYAIASAFDSYYSPWLPTREVAEKLSAAVGPNPTVLTIAGRLQPAHPLTRMVGGVYLSRDPSLWRVRSADLLMQRETDPARKAEHLARRNSEIATAAAQIVKLRPDVVIAGGTYAARAEIATMSDPGIISALASYSVLYRDEISTIYIRKP